MQSRDPLTHVIGTCAAQIAAIATPIISPLIIGGLIVGFRVGEAEAGGLMTVELLTIGFISIAVAPFIARVPHHLLAIAGASVLILASVSSARVVDFNELYLWRILAGIGCGCLVTTANAAIAQSRTPILLYGLAWAAAYTVTAALAIVITETNETVTANIVYAWLAGALIFLLPLLWLLPKQGGKASAAPFPRETLKTGSRLMLGIMIFGISMMAYYAFLERIATSIGASPAVTGRIIAASQVAGIAGGLIAAHVANTFGLLRSLISATVLHALVIVFAIWTEQTLPLGIAAFSEAVLFIIIITLVLTLAAQVDSKGRWAAAAGGVFTLSTAFGPILGGVLIEKFGYIAIAWLQVLAVAPGVYIFARVHREMGQKNESK